MKNETYGIYLAYKIDDSIDEEVVQAVKHGEYYEISSIPIFASNLAVGDSVSVENENGKLYFLDLNLPSDHSTVQIVFFKPDDRASFSLEIEALACRCSHVMHNYMAIDVPRNIDYCRVHTVLERYQKLGSSDFKEACLSDKHRADIHLKR